MVQRDLKLLFSFINLLVFNIYFIFKGFIYFFVLFVYLVIYLQHYPATKRQAEDLQCQDFLCSFKTPHVL